jgi:hypothetical protein
VRSAPRMRSAHAFSFPHYLLVDATLSASQVTANMKWVVVKGMFCFSKPLSSAGFQIKRTYETYVLDYERR